MQGARSQDRKSSGVVQGVRHSPCQVIAPAVDGGGQLRPAGLRIERAADKVGEILTEDGRSRTDVRGTVMSFFSFECLV